MRRNLEAVFVSAIAASLNHICLHHQPAGLALNLGIHNTARYHKLYQINTV